MNAKERLLQYLELKGISKSKFYQETKLSNGYLDKNPNINSDRLEIISSVYRDINLIWLVTGEGDMLISGTEPQKKESPIIRVEVGGIPLIPIDAMAGFTAGNGDAVLNYECDRYIVPMFKGAEFLIPVKGSSMQPKYNSGDLVACIRVPLDTFFLWHKVYVIDTEQGALIKRIEKAEDNDYILLVSDNPDYPPVELHRSKIFSIAAVIGVIRLE